MPRGLAIHAIDQVHGAGGIMAFELRLNPDGEELRAPVPLLDLAEVDVAVGKRSVLAEIGAFAHEPLPRGAGRGNYQRRLINPAPRLGVFHPRKLALRHTEL